MKKTTTRTFSINDDVYRIFDKIIKDNKQLSLLKNEAQKIGREFYC